MEVRDRGEIHRVDDVGRSSRALSTGEVGDCELVYDLIWPGRRGERGERSRHWPGNTDLFLRVSKLPRVALSLSFSLSFYPPVTKVVRFAWLDDRNFFQTRRLVIPKTGAGDAYTREQVGERETLLETPSFVGWFVGSFDSVIGLFRNAFR